MARAAGVVAEGEEAAEEEAEAAVAVVAVAVAAGLNLVRSLKNETGFKNVYKDHGRYTARIRENGKYNHLGTFETPEEAALCYARHIGPEQAAAEAHVR